jgi:hypothetical protein
MCIVFYLHSIPSTFPDKPPRQYLENKTSLRGTRRFILSCIPTSPLRETRRGTISYGSIKPSCKNVTQQVSPQLGIKPNYGKLIWKPNNNIG